MATFVFNYIDIEIKSEVMELWIATVVMMEVLLTLEYYGLLEILQVALMLYAVENGKVNEWKGRQMKDIVVEGLIIRILLI